MQQQLHEVVKQYVLDLIQDNAMVANYLLPSENQISIKLNVSRFSVRKALGALEDEGIIYRIKGKGAFVSERSTLFNTREKVNNKKDFIAFIVPNFTTSFTRQISQGIKDYCNEVDINVMFLCAFAGSSEEEKCINFAKSIGCKGMIIFPSDDDNYNNGILALALNKFPTVLVDRMLFGLNLHYVGSDNVEIGYKATKHLIKNHKHICMITANDTISSVRDRINGYKQCLKEHNITYRRHFIHDDHPSADHLDSFIQYFSENPEITAIICNSGLICHLLLKAMTAIGKKLGKDYEVLLIDSESGDAQLLLGTNFPSIIQDTHKIGYIAAKTLCDHIYHNIPPRSQKIPLKITPHQ